VIAVGVMYLKINIGYLYGILFYYSVLEHVVKQRNNDHDEKFLCKQLISTVTFDDVESRLLSSLASIGNLKPPFLQYMKLCLHTQVIDHVFFVYIRPLVVIFLLGIVAFTARRFKKVTVFVRRHSSTLICLLLLLAYSSVSYTSIQLLKPLAVYDTDAEEIRWYMYWSPFMPFAYKWRLLYVVVAVVCEIVISMGLPVFLLSEQFLVGKLNLNLIRIKPILDQLQGCYKNDYRWFAAYYLICRQVIYITDLTIDFLSSIYPQDDKYKFLTFLVMCIVMLTIHVWFQPYKKRSLNILDSVVLVIMSFVIIASFTTNFFLKFFLWFLPLILFFCFIIYSTKLKQIVIPIVCFVVALYCSMLVLSYEGIIAFIIAIVSLYFVIKYIYHLIKYVWRTFQSRQKPISSDSSASKLQNVCSRYVTVYMTAYYVYMY